MTKPEKISFEEFFNSLSPVIGIPVYEQFDNAYESMKNMIVQTYNENRDSPLKDILIEIFKLKLERNDDNNAFFKKLERNEYFGFEILLGIIGFSYESIKNIILPYWDKITSNNYPTNKIDFNLLTQGGKYSKLIAELFTKGYEDSQLTDIIKDDSIFLNRFTLTKELMEIYIDNDHLLKRAIENKYDSRFSNKKGYFVEDFVIGKVFKKKELSYEKGRIINLEKYYGRKKQDRSPDIDLVYPSLKHPIICIESSYNLTTASGQTKKIDSNHELHLALKKYSKKSKQEIIFINFVDGAGWIARGKSDLERFYDNCDYIINHQKLYELDKIIEYYKESDNQSKLNGFL